MASGIGEDAMAAPTANAVPGRLRTGECERQVLEDHADLSNRACRPPSSERCVPLLPHVCDGRLPLAGRAEPSFIGDEARVLS